MLHHLKGLLSPFVSALKVIRFLFANCQKGLATACKIQKIRENKRVFACGSRIPSYSLQKGLWLPVELLQKVIKYPLEAIACGICELHATPIMIAIYWWENLILNFKNVGKFKNSVYHPRFLYSWKSIQPHHFKANLIWCDGTFNPNRMTKDEKVLAVFIGLLL